MENKPWHNKAFHRGQRESLLEQSTFAYFGRHYSTYIKYPLVSYSSVKIIIIFVYYSH
jgi:hypothetical protein